MRYARDDAISDYRTDDDGIDAATAGDNSGG
ncbi:cytidyltransferase-related domain protein [Natrinema gari JCM 14663]|uniref:Cytidyltransferase-related domain protein n=1 Tax=Natrinema gari JCM 14663 TaxID=1230459 RepID=L9Z8R0_9EURY|nr:cytidyltransferase-related domain protein [Natrinema gari JCM 14663]